MDLTNERASALAHCPACQKDYDQKDVRVVLDHPGHSILHAACHSCKREMLLAVDGADRFIRVSGVLTDCTYDDAKRFQLASNITIDDVIVSHEITRLDTFLKKR